MVIAGDLLARRIDAAPVNLKHTPDFIHWGVIQISLANLIVVALMIVIFVLAIVLPFPHGKDRS